MFSVVLYHLDQTELAQSYLSQYVASSSFIQTGGMTWPDRLINVYTKT